MGTESQELGHDQVILYFEDKVIKLKEKNKNEDGRARFLIVRPATGPKKDIHFWNPEHNEFTSGYNVSKNQKVSFIPEWQIRGFYPKKIIEPVNETSEYWKANWYISLSRKFRDLKTFVENLESKLSKPFNNDFPDILGISEKGLTFTAEIKYEGFGKKSLPQIKNHYKGIIEMEIPYYLVVPKTPFYSRLNKTFLKNLLKEPNRKIDIYTFAFNIEDGRPTLETIKFEKFED